MIMKYKKGFNDRRKNRKFSQYFKNDPDHEYKNRFQTVIDPDHFTHDPRPLLMVLPNLSNQGLFQLSTTLR